MRVRLERDALLRVGTHVAAVGAPHDELDAAAVHGHPQLGVAGLGWGSGWGWGYVWSQGTRGRVGSQDQSVGL